MRGKVQDWKIGTNGSRIVGQEWKTGAPTTIPTGIGDGEITITADTIEGGNTAITVPLMADGQAAITIHPMEQPANRAITRCPQLLMELAAGAIAITPPALPATGLGPGPTTETPPRQPPPALRERPAAPPPQQPLGQDDGPQGQILEPAGREIAGGAIATTPRPRLQLPAGLIPPARENRQPYPNNLNQSSLIGNRFPAGPTRPCHFFAWRALEMRFPASEVGPPIRFSYPAERPLADPLSVFVSPLKMSG